MATKAKTKDEGELRQPRDEVELPSDAKGVTDAEIDAALAGAEGVAPIEDDEDAKGDAAAEDAAEAASATAQGRPRKTHAERRATQRAAADRDAQRIARLEEELRISNDRTAALEGRAAHQDTATLDTQLSNAQMRVEAAKEARAAARDAKDLAAEEAAEDALYAARRQAEILGGVRARVDAERKTGGERPAAAPRVDPEIASRARGWMGRNAWYDPRGDDIDSKKALLVDAEVKMDGFDPRTDDYWDEFEARLKNKLPHRFTNGGNGSKRTADAGGNAGAAGQGGDQRARGGSPTGGSSRESAAAEGGSRFTIPAEYVRNLKDAGYDWDDPGVRKRMTARYIAEQKNIASEGNRRR